jgi:chromosome segregation ATPase
MEIEQERQSRSQADKQVEALRAQLAQGEARERAAALENADVITRLQAKCDAAQAAASATQQECAALKHEVSTAREQLQASQQEVTRYRAEAQSVQAVIDRLTASAPVAATKPSRKKAGRTRAPLRPG